VQLAHVSQLTRYTVASHGPTEPAASQGAPRTIVVTAEGGAAEWRALRELGGDTLLLKPFDADQLVDAIHRCATMLVDSTRACSQGAPVTKR
jgi:DNA-binding response OmpR family regulator